MRTEDADSVTSSLAAGHDTPAAHSSQPRLNANRTLPPSHAFYELFPVSDCPRTAQQLSLLAGVSRACKHIPQQNGLSKPPLHHCRSSSNARLDLMPLAAMRALPIPTPDTLYGRHLSIQRNAKKSRLAAATVSPPNARQVKCTPQFGAAELEGVKSQHPPNYMPFGAEMPAMPVSVSCYTQRNDAMELLQPTYMNCRWVQKARHRAWISVALRRSRSSRSSRLRSASRSRASIVLAAYARYAHCSSTQQ
jgi:hypothetical protein